MSQKSSCVAAPKPMIASIPPKNTIPIAIVFTSFVFCRSPVYTQPQRKRLLFLLFFPDPENNGIHDMLNFTYPLDFTVLKCYNVSIQFTILKR